MHHVQTLSADLGIISTHQVTRKSLEQERNTRAYRGFVRFEEIRGCSSRIYRVRKHGKMVTVVCVLIVRMRISFHGLMPFVKRAHNWVGVLSFCSRHAMLSMNDSARGSSVSRNQITGDRGVLLDC